MSHRQTKGKAHNELSEMWKQSTTIRVLALLRRKADMESMIQEAAGATNGNGDSPRRVRGVDRALRVLLADVTEDMTRDQMFARFRDADPEKAARVKPDSFRNTVRNLINANFLAVVTETVGTQPAVYRRVLGPNQEESDNE